MRPKPSRKPTTRSAAPHASQNSQNSGRTDSTLRKRTQSRTPHTPQKNITIPIQPWYGVSLSIRSLALGLRAMMSDEAARMPPAMVISPESMEFLPMGVGGRCGNRRATRKYLSFLTTAPCWHAIFCANEQPIRASRATRASEAETERSPEARAFRQEGQGSGSAKRGIGGLRGSADYGDRRKT